MAEPFIGEIRLFAGNFPPRGFAFCDGQLLAINQNDALFALLGTTYGGDGRTTFGLPDLRGRVPIGVGNGPGLSDRRWGSRGGTESETLVTAQLPGHRHPVSGVTAPAANPAPGADQRYAEPESDAYATGDVVAGPATGNAGGGQPHDNNPPQLAVSYIIALVGVFPSRQ